jgi:hypothetical protein
MKNVNVRLWSAGIALVSLCLIFVITFAISMVFLVYCILLVFLVALSLRSFSLLGGILSTVIDELPTGGGGSERINKRLIGKLRATRHYMVATTRASGVTLLTTVAVLLFKPDHKYEGSSRAANREAINVVLYWIPFIGMLAIFRLHAAYISDPLRERECERFERWSSSPADSSKASKSTSKIKPVNP